MHDFNYHKDVLALESRQKRFALQIPGMRRLSHHVQLKKSDPHSLEFTNTEEHIDKAHRIPRGTLQCRC